MLLVSDDINPGSRTLAERVVIAVPLTVAPETPITVAIAQMHQAQTSYALVTRQQRPVGIFAEPDLVRWVATSQSMAPSADPLTDQSTAILPTAAPISGVMTLVPTISIAEVRDADKLFQQMQRDQLRYLPVVDQQGRLAGVITPASLLNQDEGDRPAQCWQVLLEEIDLAAAGIDSAGKLTYVNPYLLRLMGYPAAALLGRDWCECLVSVTERSQLKQYFQQFFNQLNTPLRCQSTVLSQAGVAHSIAWHNTPIKNSQGSVVGVLSIGKPIHDIHERFVFDRLRRDFVSLVSHELRTPLTAVHGSLQLVSQGLVASQSEQGQRLLQIAAEGSQRLVALMNKILDLEQLENDQQLLQKQPISTRSLTDALADTWRIAADQKGLSLTVIDPDVQMVVDGDRLSDVLTHLLDNAIKFSPADATIWLTVTDGTDDSTVRFAVCDQGPGIPAEQRSQIFERFVQLDVSDARQTTGLGLGLATCRHMVEQHGGRLWAESRPGGGNCFYFTLPIS